MASACLPTVFQAVEIDGVPYWDGGYMGNPALFPLFYETMTDDILLVQINPLERRQTPRTVSEIHNRLNEITFNGNLLRELRAVAFVKRLIEEENSRPTNTRTSTCTGSTRAPSSTITRPLRSAKRNGISLCSFAMPGGGPLNPGSQPIRERSGYAARSMWRALCNDAGHHPPAHAFTRSRSLADVAREPGRRAPRSAITRTADMLQVCRISLGSRVSGTSFRNSTAVL